MHHRHVAAADRLAARLVEDLPVNARRLEIAGVSTPLLEGGAGPPIVLLHGQDGFAETLGGVAAGLVDRYRVVAPDLPGLGRSEPLSEQPGPSAVLGWLAALVAATCAEPPVVLGAGLGGSIALRFAVERRQQIRQLVLVGAGSLGRFRPPPSLRLALHRFRRHPNRANAQRLFRHHFADTDRLQTQIGGRLTALQDYMIERARQPSVGAANRTLLRQIGTTQIPDNELRRITAPVALIWGHQDQIVPLTHAERAHGVFGWPLNVIDDAGHIAFIEQPDAFAAALRAALDLTNQPPQQKENP